MKSATILCLLSLVGVVACNFWAYSGTTVGPTTKALFPDYSSSGCSNGYISSPYVTQDINVTTAGYYVLTALFDKASVGDAIISIYSTFNPSTPCNSVTGHFSNNADAPHIYIPVFLNASIYTVVVTVDYPTYGGIFGWQLRSVDWYGSVSGASNYWTFPSSYSPTTTCKSSGVVVPYNYYTWTQKTTGYFDINVWAQNATETFTAVTALYNTTAANLPFIGHGTSAAPVDGCANSTAYFVNTLQSDDYVHVTNSKGTGLVYGYVMLTAGMNYTMLVSLNYDYVVTFGVTVTPTIYHMLGSTANFPIPDGATPTTCVANEKPAEVWDAFLFSVPYPYLVVATGDVTYNGFNAIVALYTGNNTGSADQTVAPLPCTNFIASEYDHPIGYSGYVGNYTTVVSPNAPASQNSGFYTLYAYSGIPMGTSTSTTGASVTSTTGMSITTGSTSAAPTTTTTTTTTTTAASSSTTTRTTTAAATGSVSTTTTTTGFATSGLTTGVISGRLTTGTTGHVITGAHTSGAPQKVASLLALATILLDF
jgi:hypothetical protein